MDLKDLAAHIAGQQSSEGECCDLEYEEDPALEEAVSLLEEVAKHIAFIADPKKTKLTAKDRRKLESLALEIHQFLVDWDAANAEEEEEEEGEI